MTDHLVEIEPKDLYNLKNLYHPDGTKSYIAYLTIDNYIRWFEQDPHLKNVKVFCLNGDYTDGTFVLTDRYSAYADTFALSFDRLTRLLQLIDYTNGYTFLSTRTALRPVIRNVLEKVNVDVIKDDTTLLYYLPKEKALQFDVQPSDDIELRPVTELSDLEKANAVWPHCNPNSLVFFQQMSKFNVNIGAFKKIETDDNTLINKRLELVSWMFRLPTGLHGALQTDENHYGKGYGALVMRYVSKKIAEMGHDVYAGIFEKNTPSRKLFDKHGFKSIGEVHWITTRINLTPNDD